jgi:hypothetical protein
MGDPEPLEPLTEKTRLPRALLLLHPQKSSRQESGHLFSGHIAVDAIRPGPGRGAIVLEPLDILKKGMI